MQTVIQTSRRLDSFLHEAAQNFEVFSNIFKSEIKKSKPIAVDVLFNAYPMWYHSHVDPIWPDGGAFNAIGYKNHG